MAVARLPPTLSADAAIARIRHGDLVFLGTACATPSVLAGALQSASPAPQDVELVHFITDGAVALTPDSVTSAYRHRTFFMSREMQSLSETGGKVDYVPISLPQVSALVRAGRIRPDVAFIQVSPPDAGGFVSLGVSVDVTACMVEHARTVIAEVNPRMPRPQGEAFIHSSRIAAFVQAEREITEYRHWPADAIATQVAAYLSNLIDDGSTVHVGMGQITNEALRHLRGRRDLGIHTDALTDAVLELVESGSATGREKGMHRGRAVGSFAFGTRRLYDALDNDPRFALYPIEYVCDPGVIAAQRRMVSLVQAFSMDLTGQACVDQFGGRYYGGLSSSPEFLRAAAASPGGKPVICLASTTPDGKTSRIRGRLPEGEGVGIARADVHYVVTEFGVAYLFGKSIRERALALIEIAHPDFRDMLLQEAKRLGYLPPAQTLASHGAYPVHEERVIRVRDGRELRVRPARASDGDAIREVFHDMSEDDVYTRFFRRLTCLSFVETQRLCNVNYDTEVAFVAVEGPPENERVAGTGSYYLNQSNGLAEVAYMIRPEWQGTGLGRVLQQRLFEYGTARGVRGFVAEILRANSKMLRLAKSACDQVEVAAEDDCYVVTMYPSSAKT
jgi:acyl-CoA hydrolase/RimJ/RimL family protein N-acetyltransferase